MSEPDELSGKRKRVKRTLEEDDYTTINLNDKTKLTPYEKTDLFNSLIQHGSSDKDLLCSFVPTKPEETIKNFINNYKRMARAKYVKGEDASSSINKWLDFMIRYKNLEPEKLNDLSRALKYISLFEHNKDPMLSNCYKLLSDCCKGEGPKHLNPETSLFMFQNIQNLVRFSRGEDNSKELKVLENITKKVASYGARRNTNSAKPILDPNIGNPLKIPESVLNIKNK